MKFAIGDVVRVERNGQSFHVRVTQLEQLGINKGKPGFAGVITDGLYADTLAWGHAGQVAEVIK